LGVSLLGAKQGDCSIVCICACVARDTLGSIVPCDERWVGEKKEIIVGIINAIKCNIEYMECNSMNANIR